MLSPASNKAKLFAKNFPKHSILMILVSLYLFSLHSKTVWYFHNSQDCWKGHNEPWFIRGIWAWLYSSGDSKELWAWTLIYASWTFQYMSERVLFSRSLEDLMGDSVFKNVGERSTAKNYHPVGLLSVVSKVYEKLANDRIVDNLEKFDLFG